MSRARSFESAVLAEFRSESLKTAMGFFEPSAGAMTKNAAGELQIRIFRYRRHTPSKP